MREEREQKGKKWFGERNKCEINKRETGLGQLINLRLLIISICFSDDVKSSFSRNQRDRVLSRCFELILTHPQQTARVWFLWQPLPQMPDEACVFIDVTNFGLAGPEIIRTIEQPI